MSIPAPRDKTLAGVLRDLRERLGLVERRLAIGGSGGGEPMYDSGWVDLTPFVTFATGWSYNADSGSSPGIKARRVGATVHFFIMNARVAAGTVNVTTNGNISNSPILSGIPAEFRPAAGTIGALAPAAAGPTASASITAAGNLSLTAIAPDSTYTATTALGQVDFSFAGSYMGEGSKPLGPGTVATPATGAVLAGLIMGWDSNTIPSGWLLCDGSPVSRAAYPELFAVIGTLHGAGDGSTTFNVPNYKGRTLVGQDPAQPEFDVLGETGGAKAHTLTGAETPWASSAEEAPGYGLTATSAFQNRVAVTRGGAGTSPHNNLQPYAVANYIISTGSGVGGGGSSTPALPDPVTVLTATVTHTVTAGAGLWQDIPAMTHTVTLPYPAWVRVDFDSQISATAAEYGMIGVAAVINGVTLNPEDGQDGGVAGQFGRGTAYHALGNTGSHARAYGTKMFLLPAGTTILKMQMRRSGTAVTPVVSYPTLLITVERWVGAPGASVSMTRGTTAQRDTVYGVPSTDAARAALANQEVEWFNTDFGWEESYYAPFGLAGLTAPGLVVHASIPAGWYPTGRGPRAILYCAGPILQSASANYTNWKDWAVGAAADGSKGSVKNTPGNTNTVPFFYRLAGNAALQTFTAGRYRAFLSMHAGTGSGTCVPSFRINTFGADRTHAFPVTLSTGFGQLYKASWDDILMTAGAFCYHRLEAGSGVSLGSADESFMGLEYLGPPLAGV